MQTIEKWQFPEGVYWTVEDVQQQLHISRSAAYRLISELPDGSKIRIVDNDSPHTFVAAVPAAVRLAWSRHRGRGNPNFKDPRFQAEMARKRHQKA